MFGTYLKLGIDHIADIQAYDHLLFIVVLCVAYSIRQWRQLLILVTAFTIGHSITLALASLQWVRIPGIWIEILIPVTIMITALQNLILEPNKVRTWHTLYLLPLFFGLIHGMGFSNFFRSLIVKDDSIVLPLLAFNIGVEIGQLVIIAIFSLISFIVIRLFKVKELTWRILISAIAIALAMYMVYERVPEL